MRLKTLNSSIDGAVPLKRTYDIRIRNAIATSRNPNLFPDGSSPKKTPLKIPVVLAATNFGGF